jgi:shikimate 5-dehydrogenase
MMFIYQAQLAFKIWHKILPKINNKLLDWWLELLF